VGRFQETEAVFEAPINIPGWRWRPFSFSSGKVSYTTSDGSETRV